jgi:hypothetical protein
MPSPQPVEGRCGAPCHGKRGFCLQKPLKGATRCKMHGGKNQLKGNPSRRKHGNKSPYIRGIEQATQEEIDRAVTDPNLLDVRRSVALSEVALGDSMLFPDEAMLLELGRRKWFDTLSLEQIQKLSAAHGKEYWVNVPEVYMELARRSYMKASLGMIERHGRTQVAALRQIEVGRLMREATIPMFTEMGLRLGRLIDHYVPEEKRKPFIAAFRNECRAVIADLQDLREAKANK